LFLFQTKKQTNNRVYVLWSCALFISKIAHTHTHTHKNRHCFFCSFDRSCIVKQFLIAVCLQTFCCYPRVTLNRYNVICTKSLDQSNNIRTHIFSLLLITNRQLTCAVVLAPSMLVLSHNYIRQTDITTKKYYV